MKLQILFIAVMLFSLFAATLNAQETVLARVNYQGKYGFINSQGEFIIQPQYDFITIAELGINHCFRLDKEYLICGYPTYRTSLNDTKKEEKHAGFSGFTKIIGQARLDKVKLRPQQIGLNRLKIINCETKTKASKFEFNGISGCGLWYLRNFDAVQNQKIEKYLVGLMVYDEKTKNILIATKIDMVSELLRQIFNMYDIPKSIINTTIDI